LRQSIGVGSAALVLACPKGKKSIENEVLREKSLRDDDIRSQSHDTPLEPSAFSYKDGTSDSLASGDETTRLLRRLWDVDVPAHGRFTEASEELRGCEKHWRPFQNIQLHFQSSTTLIS